MNNPIASGPGGRCSDLGLLILRVGIGGSMFLRHGWEKVAGFSQMAAHFPNPIGIGSEPSLVIALLADAVCAILMVFGLATRWAALVIFFNLLVAFVFVHHLAFFGKGPQVDHGELIVEYMVASLALAIAGPGRYSLDGRLRASAPPAPAKASGY